MRTLPIAFEGKGCPMQVCLQARAQLTTLAQRLSRPLSTFSAVLPASAPAGSQQPAQYLQRPQHQLLL